MHKYDSIDILMQMPGYCCWKDISLRYRGCNLHFANAAGFETVEQIYHKNDYDMIWGQLFGTLYRKRDQRVLQGHRFTNFIEQNVNTKGKLIHVMVNKLPLYNKAKQIDGVICHYYETNHVTHADRHIALTNKQKMCLEWVVQGLTAKEIAREMNLSYRTVERYIENLKEKFNCRNKSELIIKFLQQQ